jgi:hypothetical protein
MRGSPKTAHYDAVFIVRCASNASARIAFAQRGFELETLENKRFPVGRIVAIVKGAVLSMT